MPQAASCVHLWISRDLMDSKKIDMPHTRGVNGTYKTAPRVTAEVGVGQLSLPDSADDE